ncbi:MAG: TPM domain-containing protein [Treponema sp.]|nr:TPM domain-containing protein [Treponema sp.]
MDSTKNQKIILAFAILLIIFPLAQAGPAEYTAVPAPTNDFFINDFAGALSDPVKKEILAKGAAVEKSTGAQAVVVIIDSLQGRSRDDLSLEILRTWGIGQKEKNNGILLLAAINDRQVKIEVGYGLEGALPDGKCGRILDECFAPSMRDGSADAAVLKTYDAILLEIANEYGMDPKNLMEGTEYSLSAPSPVNGTLGTIIIFLIFIVIMIIITLLKGKGGGYNRGGGSSFGGNFRGGGGFHGGGGRGGGGGAGRGW